MAPWIPPNSSGIAPCRSTSVSSILSAPAVIPATRHPTFSPAFTPAGRPILTCSPARSARPQRCASAITGTRPARDTRLLSSNDACVFARPCNNRTCEVSSPARRRKLQQLPSSQLRGHPSRRHAPHSRPCDGGSRLRRADLSAHTPNHPLAVENELNNRPRRVLGDRAPANLFAALLASQSPPVLRR